MDSREIWSAKVVKINDISKKNREKLVYVRFFQYLCSRN